MNKTVPATAAPKPTRASLLELEDASMAAPTMDLGAFDDLGALEDLSFGAFEDLSFGAFEDLSFGALEDFGGLELFRLRRSPSLPSNIRALGAFDETFADFTVFGAFELFGVAFDFK